MQQCSHQTLMSVPRVSIAFATFIKNPPDVSSARCRLFLKAGHSRRTVVGLMPAFGRRTGQHELSARMRRFAFPFTPVESEENGCLALLAFDAEVPFCIYFGPARNLHSFVLGRRIGFPSVSVKGRTVPGDSSSAPSLYTMKLNLVNDLPMDDEEPASSEL
jgi:hypothetical protein